MSEHCVCCGREIPEGLQVCPQCEFSGKEPHIKDSGNRREFSTGAVRDIQEGKGRCDLLPLDVIDVLCEPAIVIHHLSIFQDTGDVSSLYQALRAFCSLREWDIPTMLLEVSKHFEEGAKKYSENNWKKGIPVHCYIDSAVRHYLKWSRGDTDEPHDRAFLWNLLCCVWTVKHIGVENETKQG